MITKSTINFIKHHEGVRYEVYKDVAGLDTIGVGHLLLDTDTHLRGKKLNDLEVDALLQKDLKWVDEAIKKYVFIKLTQNEYDALASFIFNFGAGAFKKSTLLAYVNQGKKGDVITNEFLKWVKAGGKTIKGLIFRREAEAKLFNTAGL